MPYIYIPIIQDCFDTLALGYRYDRLPTLQPQQIRAPPTWAVFNEVGSIKCGLVHDKV